MSSLALPLAASLVLVCGGPAALAGISQATCPTPGGFVQAGAYPTSCGCSTVDIGGDLTVGYGTTPDFHELAFASPGPAAVSAAHSQTGMALSINANAGMGHVGAVSSNAHGDFDFFAIAIADGGWKDSLTVSHPALNGQQGFLVFRVHAAGSMNTYGLTGSAVVQIKPFKDNIEIPTNTYADRGNSDVPLGVIQEVRWGLASYGQPDSRQVDGTVTFSVPITFGQSFSLGVYARLYTGQRSSGGFGAPSGSTLDFADGVTWAGISGVLNSAGGAVNGATITSGSGIDWTNPFNSCPADFNGDGFLDFFDIDAFVAAFENGDPAGDFNGDGFTDFFDADAFVGAFEAGC